MSASSWLPLVGVALGGVLGGGTTFAIDRSRWSRETRAEQRRIQLDAYTEFAVAAKDTMLLCFRVAAHLGWDPQTDPLTPQEAAPLFADNVHRRDQAFERVVMLGAAEVVQAARDWVPAVHEMRERLKSGSADRGTWSTLVASANAGRTRFEETARSAALTD